MYARIASACHYEDKVASEMRKMIKRYNRNGEVCKLREVYKKRRSYVYCENLKLAMTQSGLTF